MRMVKDCVYKQAAIDALKELPTWYGDAGCLPFGDPQPPMEALLYPDDAVSAIENLQPADVKSVRHGRWINDRWENDVNYHTCNACGVEIRVTYFDNYCSNCGARMDGEVNDDR